MAYKVNLNGVIVEVETLAEVKELAGLTAKQEALPSPPPPEEVEVEVKPKAKKQPPKQLELPDPQIPSHSKDIKTGVLRRSLAVQDAIRAVDLAFQKHHTPIDLDQIGKFSAVPWTRSGLNARLKSACDHGYIQRLAAGVYAPREYSPEPLDGISKHTQKNMPTMALPIIRILIENPNREWTATDVIDEMLNMKLSGTREAAKVRLWAARRGGWVDQKDDDSLTVTQAGLDFAAAAEPKE